MRLTGAKAMAAFAVCTLPLLAGFVLPAVLLVRMALGAAGSESGVAIGARFARLAGNSLLLASVTAVVAVLLALLLAYSARAGQGRRARCPQPAGVAGLCGARLGDRRRRADPGDAPGQLAGGAVGRLVRHQSRAC